MAPSLPPARPKLDLTALPLLDGVEVDLEAGGRARLARLLRDLADHVEHDPHVEGSLATMPLRYGDDAVRIDEREPGALHPDRIAVTVQVRVPAGAVRE